MNPIVKAAIIHAQFETIHPFLDGNGRIGRLMINLFLKENALLSLPTLYISCFLKRNRIEYYDRLTAVREKGDFEQWVKFFLQAVFESAQDAIESIDRLTELHEKNTKIIQENITRSKSVLRIFNYLENTPIIDIKKTAVEIELAYNTVSNAVKKLEELRIIKQVGEARRSRTFAYEEYLSILRKDT